jgi:hypothetical protein
MKMENSVGETVDITKDRSEVDKIEDTRRYTNTWHSRFDNG